VKDRAWLFASPWAILAATCLAYASTLGSSFHFDDYSLFNDPVVTAGGVPFEFSGLSYSRSLAYVSFWLNFRLGGEAAFGYHVVNVALHLGVVAAAWAVFQRLLEPRVAWLATAIVALHPLQTEPVAYVYGRASVIATLFCLLSIRSWLDGRRWLAVAWFCCSLLGKEEALVFPVLLVGLEWLRGGCDWPKIARPVGVMIACVIGAAARLLYAIRVTPDVGVAFDVEAFSGSEYLFTQGRVIAEYLRLVLWPVGQNFDRDWPLAQLSDVWAWLGWLVVLVVLVTGVKFARGPGGLGAGAFCIAGLLLLAPTSSIIPLADLIAERRMYLPMIAFAPAFAMGFQRVFRLVRLEQVSVALVILMFTATTARALVWQSEESLWRDVVSKSPEKIRPKLQLARAVASSTEREELLVGANRLDPLNVDAAIEYGVFLLDAGRLDNALTEFRRAESIDPTEPNAIANQGAALQLLGRGTEATHAYRRALDLEPCHRDARANLVDLLRADGMDSVADEWDAGSCN